MKHLHSDTIGEIHIYPVGLLADWFAQANPRTAPVVSIIRQAAAVDEEAAQLERRRAAQRLRNYHLAAAAVRERGGLSTGVSDDAAAATIWAIGHPNAYQQLVVESGWPGQAYRDWVYGALAAALR